MAIGPSGASLSHRCPTGSLVVLGDGDAELPAMPAAAPAIAQVAPTAAVRITVDLFICAPFLFDTAHRDPVL
jgi:hypothetical protein